LIEIVISRFRCDIYGICALLSCYAAYSGKSLLMFRDNLWVRSSGHNKSTKKASHRNVLCVISGFHRDGEEICALLGVTQRVVVNHCRRFGTTYRSHLHGVKKSFEVNKRDQQVNTPTFASIRHTN